MQAFSSDAPTSEPVGVIICKQSIHRDMTNRGYIAMLSVRKEWRNRGIGRCSLPPFSFFYLFEYHTIYRLIHSHLFSPVFPRDSHAHTHARLYLSDLSPHSPFSRFATPPPLASTLVRNAISTMKEDGADEVSRSHDLSLFHYLTLPRVTKSKFPRPPGPHPPEQI